jgi:hypothetical protein
MSAEAKLIFQSVYGCDANFMTPTIIDYLMSDDMVIELSRGEGLGRGPIYGVTAVIKEDGEWKKNHDLCRCCHSRHEMYRYVATLLEKESE